MNRWSTQKRSGFVAAAAVTAGALFAPGAQADHEVQQRVSAPLPAVGPYEVCVDTGDGPTCKVLRAGEGGELVLTIDGFVSHDETDVKRNPGECDGRLGVKIEKAGNPTGATVIASVSGVDDPGPVGYTTAPRNPISARACLMEQPVEDPEVPEAPQPELPALGGGTGGAPPSSGQNAGGRSAPPSQPQASRQQVASQPASTAALQGRLRTRRQRLNRVLSRGYGLAVQCSGACSIDSRLFISKRDAKRIGMAASGPLMVGQVSSQLGSAGESQVVIRLSRQARRQLKGARSLRLSLQVAISDAAGTSRTLGQSFTVKR